MTELLSGSTLVLLDALPEAALILARTDASAI
jgi:hypothetical protein